MMTQTYGWNLPLLQHSLNNNNPFLSVLAAASASLYSVMKNSLPVCLMTGGCGGDVA